MSATLTPPRTMGLQDLSAELLRREETRFHFHADTVRMRFHTDVMRQTMEGDNGVYGSKVLGLMSYLYADGIDHPSMTPDGFIVGDYAHAQIAGRLGIPKKYYDKMRVESPELLDRNVGHWLINDPKVQLVRVLDGRVRAFLSDRYRRLDNIDLLQLSLIPVMEEFGSDLQFQMAALTDTRLYITGTLPGLVAPDPGSIRPYGRGGEEVGTYYGGQAEVGDVIQAGFALRNSEVGAGALVAEPRLLRLACKNGLTVPAYAMRKYHVGKQVSEEEDALDVFSDETIAADDIAFFLKVRDVIKAALDEARFAEIMERLNEAANSEPIKRIVKASEVLQSRFSLTEDEGENVLTYLAAGGDLTQWGAANAVTRAAQDVESYDRQAEMEAMGGVLAVIPQGEWKTIANAS